MNGQWVNFLNILGSGLQDVGAGFNGQRGGNLNAFLGQQQQQKTAKDIGAAFAPQQQFTSPTGPGNPTPQIGTTSGMPDIKTLAPLLLANPQFAGPVLEMLKMMQPEKGAGFTLSPGQTRYGPDGNQVANAPEAPAAPAPFNLSPGQVRYGADGNPIASLPSAATPPQTRTRHDGDKEIIEQFNPQSGGYDKISEAPRWQPNAPAAAGEKESWGQPISEAGPDGKPIQVRYGNRLGREVVEGAVPAPRTRAPAAKMINDLVKVGTNVENLGRLKDTFEDRFGGNVVLGDMANTMGRTLGDSTGQAQWWQDYQSYINVVRNELFGAALTDTEKAEFEKSIITPRMNAGEARKNLTRQHELAGKAARRQAKPYLAAGYDREAIEGALGMGVDEVNDAAKPKLPQGGGVLAAVPAGAVSMLKQNPALAAAFDAKYGPGASRQYLGQ